MIEKIGELMSRDLFHVAAYLRNFGINVDKWDDGKDSLVAAALTFWVTAGAFNGMTAPDSTTYNLTKEIGEGGNKQDDKRLEQENIKKVIKRAYKNIPKIHEQLNKQRYIIENLDYRELIKKYNGKEYIDLQGEKQPAEENFAGKNILWYFDPPYHPWCLHAGEDALYADTFTVELANEMIDILHGDREDEFGKLEYFIKSDYDPKVAYETAKREVNNPHDGHQIAWYKKLIDMEAGNDNKKSEHKLKKYEADITWTKGMVTTLLDKLEVYPFCKVCVGGFDKGAILGKDNESRKSVGHEYIWCRGFSKGYEKLEGETAK